MKRIKIISFLIFVVISFTAGLIYLWKKNSQNPEVYEFKKARMQSIVLKTIATGSIVPEEEIPIKPNVSGIIDKINVKPGDYVKAGDVVASIRVIPNVSSVANAKNNILRTQTSLKTSKLNLDTQERIFKRQKALFDKGVISKNTFEGIENSYQQSLQSVKQAEIDLKSAKESYDIIKTGTSSSLSNMAQTQVRATISGMVLAVPVKEGNQVIEANNFNEGSTIVSLADVSRMIFKGKVDETEVGKIKEGLPLELSIGAINNKSFQARLTYISPKGIEENGAIQFDIEGMVKNKDSIFIRSGLSANASIILDKVENVLGISEALLQYDEKTLKPYVEVEVAEQEFERKYLKLGLSDGMNVQILDGLSKEDKIKVWNKLKTVEHKGSTY